MCPGKSYLPKKIREDVGDEIMSVMADKIEAKEADLGRKMKEAELKSWIEAQAHPMVLASGYQERRELVSAELFPMYLVALKIALIIILALKVFSAGFYILGNVDFLFFDIFKRLFGGLLESGLLAFGSITLVFHFLGEHIAKGKFFEKWKVKNLPEAGHKWIAVPVGEKIFEIVAYLFLLAIVNSFFLDTWDPWWDDAVTLNLGFHALIPWINAVVILSLLQNFWLVVRPHWSIPKLATNVVLAIFGFWVLTMIAGLDPILSFDQAFVTDHPDIDREDWLNKIITYSLYVVGAVIIYEFGRDLYRIYVLKR